MSAVDDHSMSPLHIGCRITRGMADTRFLSARRHVINDSTKKIKAPIQTLNGSEAGTKTEAMTPINNSNILIFQ